MDADVAALLQKHLAGGATTAETLAAVAGDDPGMAQMAQLLAQREAALQAELEAAQAAEPDEPDDEPVAIELQAALLNRVQEEAQRREDLLRGHIDALAAEVERLQETVDLVSSGLGACPSCLGGDARCPLCRGRGVPGSLPPDPQAFDRVVLPAVRAHAYARSRRTPGHGAEPPVVPAPARSAAGRSETAHPAERRIP